MKGIFHALDAKFYDWQLRAYSHIKDSSAVLSAPTGAGKTLVAYLWAGLLNNDGSINPNPDASRIIFTAPIKALSNERYLDLRRMGFDVGLETYLFLYLPSPAYVFVSIVPIPAGAANSYLLCLSIVSGLKPTGYWLTKRY